MKFGPRGLPVFTRYAPRSRFTENKQRHARALKLESHARAGLDVVRPIVAQHVGGRIPVPIKLRVKSGERSRLAQRVAGAILRIEQRVVLETADVNTVVVGLGEQAVRAARQQMAEAFA